MKKLYYETLRDNHVQITNEALDFLVENSTESDLRDVISCYKKRSGSSVATLCSIRSILNELKDKCNCKVRVKKCHFEKGWISRSFNREWSLKMRSISSPAEAFGMFDIVNGQNVVIIDDEPTHLVFDLQKAHFFLPGSYLGFNGETFSDKLLVHDVVYPGERTTENERNEGKKEKAKVRLLAFNNAGRRELPLEDFGDYDVIVFLGKISPDDRLFRVVERCHNVCFIFSSRVGSIIESCDNCVLIDPEHSSLVNLSDNINIGIIDCDISKYKCLGKFVGSPINPYPIVRLISSQCSYFDGQMPDILIIGQENCGFYEIETENLVSFSLPNYERTCESLSLKNGQSTQSKNSKPK